MASMPFSTNCFSLSNAESLDSSGSVRCMLLKLVAITRGLFLPRTFAGPKASRSNFNLLVLKS